MGMFDNIYCEYPLPSPEDQGELAGRNWREHPFQTKDFDCLMGEYRIAEDGILLLRTYESETTRKGRLRRKAAGWQAMNTHTGTVSFYDSIYASKTDYWVEWVVVFVSGKVTELKLHSWEKRDNSERLAFEAKWKLEAEKRERFLKTWVGRHLYPPYAWVVHGCFGLTVFRLGQWIGHRCQRIGLWIDRMGGKLAPYGDPIRQEQRQREWASFFDDENEDEQES